MLTSMSANSSLLSILGIIILIPLVISILYKFTDKQLLERAGAICIAVSATSLLVIVISLIVPAIAPPLANKEDVLISSLPLRLILNIVGIGIGIIIYRSRNGVSVLSSIVTCIAAIASLVCFVMDTSFVSGFTFTALLFAVVAIIRQFRDKRNRSG